MDSQPYVNGPRTRAELKAYMAADLAAHSLNAWRPWHRLVRPAVRFQRLLRRAEYQTNRQPFGRFVARAYRVRLKRAGHRLGFTVPPNVFGPGLLIAHVGTVVVNAGARVGSGFTISQGCTIGEARGRYPVIGDGCHMAPNSCVLGGVTLGDRVGVWAGAVVTRSAPSGARMAGVPARIKE